jgi:hypothetical protein
MATLAAKAPTGGGNRTLVWNILSASSGMASDLAFTFDRNETSAIVGDILLDSIELTLANKIRNAAFRTFLTSYLSRVELAAGQQVYEDGSVSSLINTPSNAAKLLVGHVDGQIDGKRQFTFFYGVLVPDTGNRALSSGSLGDTPVKFMALPAPIAMYLSSTKFYSAASDLFSCISDYPSLTSIAANTYGFCSFFSA